MNLDIMAFIIIIRNKIIKIRMGINPYRWIRIVIIWFNKLKKENENLKIKLSKLENETNSSNNIKYNEINKQKIKIFTKN